MGDHRRRAAEAMPLILVVDDSSYQRRVICDMVREAGYETLEAFDGEDGLEKVATGRLACALVDLLMPGTGGLELLESLKDQGSSLPVIILMADVQESIRKKCMQLGAAAVVTKPVDAAVLIPAIGQALDRDRT
ncbi:MAG: response regulator [Candidatus Marinimicrobia bacterium]|nr:response regulator [Candidatus Neomarinimicrobiota bacterium]